MMYTVSLSVDVEGIEAPGPVQAVELAVQALELGKSELNTHFINLATGGIAHVLPDKGAAVTVRLGRKAFTIIEGDD